MPENNHATSQLGALQEAQNPPPLGGRQVALFDANDPRALIRVVPAAVKDAMLAVLEEHGDLFELDEQQFKARLREEGRKISATDNRVRLRFWDEYDRALAESRDLNMSSVVAGVCTRDHFYKSYIHDPYRMAWLLCPPANYVTIAEEALTFGLEQLREILAMDDHELKNGMKIPNIRMLTLKVKIVEMLDQRLKGGVVQKTLSVQVGATAADVQRAGAALTMDELKRQMGDLEVRETRAVHVPKPPEKEVVAE